MRFAIVKILTNHISEKPQTQRIYNFNMAANNEGSSDAHQLALSQFLSVRSASEVDSQLQESQSLAEGHTFDKEMFLQALREFKCLWDTSDPNYKNRTMKVNAWNILSSLFNQEGMKLVHFSGPFLVLSELICSQSRELYNLH